MSINLLPWREAAEKRKINMQVCQAGGVILLLCMVCALFYVYMWNNLIGLKEEIVLLEEELKEIQFQSSDAFLKQVASVQGTKQMKVLDRVIHENKRLINILRFLLGALGHELRMEKIEKRNDIIYLFGQAASQENLMVFVKKLGEKFKQSEVLIKEMGVIEGETYKIKFVVAYE